MYRILHQLFTLNVCPCWRHTESRNRVHKNCNCKLRIESKRAGLKVKTYPEIDKSSGFNNIYTVCMCVGNAFIIFRE